MKRKRMGHFDVRVSSFDKGCANAGWQEVSTHVGVTSHLSFSDLLSSVESRAATFTPETEAFFRETRSANQLGRPIRQ